MRDLTCNTKFEWVSFYTNSYAYVSSNLIACFNFFSSTNNNKTRTKHQNYIHAQNCNQQNFSNLNVYEWAFWISFTFKMARSQLS